VYLFPDPFGTSDKIILFKNDFYMYLEKKNRKKFWISIFFLPWKETRFEMLEIFKIGFAVLCGVVGASKISKRDFFPMWKKSEIQKKKSIFFPQKHIKIIVKQYNFVTIMSNHFFFSTSESFLHNFSPHDSYVKLGFMKIWV